MRDDTLRETIEYKGYTIELHYDDDGTSPRDMSNLGIMLADGHRKYTLGDEGFQMLTGPEFDKAKRALRHFVDRLGVRLGFRAFVLWCKVYLGSWVVLPLGLIDHSGISMYVGEGAHPQDPGGWDSGTVGFIFDTAARREEMGCTPEHGFDAAKVEESLRSEVKEYDLYLTGEVYRIEIRDPDDDDVEVEPGSIIGEEPATEEAKMVVDADIKYRETHAKLANEHVAVATFRVSDVNAAIGRPLYRHEIDAVRKTLEFALNEVFAESLDAFGAADTSEDEED